MPTASKFMGTEAQPISIVKWVDRGDLIANDYNPNHMAPMESKLLKVSLLENGWTQPIVVMNDWRTIIDGFHRWNLSEDTEIFAMTGGLVPVVMADISEAQRIAATVRHNRARGQHAIDPMGDITHKLRAVGMTDDEIKTNLGMQAEEVIRLAEVRGSPQRVTDDEQQELGAAWNPGEYNPHAPGE